MRNLKEKFYRFMQGRYGNDQLNRFLIILAMMLLILSMFLGDFFYLIAVVAMIFAYYRMFSKKTYTRAGENQKYLQLEWKFKTFWSRKKSEMQQLKTQHIYKCPNCKQKIRVPRGRGKIAIRCRKCGTEFVKKS